MGHHLLTPALGKRSWGVANSAIFLSIWSHAFFLSRPLRISLSTSSTQLCIDKDSLNYLPAVEVICSRTVLWRSGSPHCQQWMPGSHPGHHIMLGHHTSCDSFSDLPWFWQLGQLQEYWQVDCRTSLAWPGGLCLPQFPCETYPTSWH